VTSWVLRTLEEDDMSTVIDPIVVQTHRMVQSSGKWERAEAGYCLWEFRNQTWLLKKDCCLAGHVPSQPPVESGRFEGQIRALAAIWAGNAAHDRSVQPTKI
jgi:hypothetical protein